MFPSNPSNSLRQCNKSHGCFHCAPYTFVTKAGSGSHMPSLNDQLGGKDTILLASDKFCAGPFSSNHILVVLLLSAAVKVIRPNARRIVASMQNAGSILWDLAVVEFPRKAMSRFVIEHPIPVIITTSSPSPTSFGRQYVRPESAYLKTGPTGGGAFGSDSTARNPEKLIKGFRKIASEAYLFVYNGVSHGVNLLQQFALWSGSLAAQTACGPRVFYHVRST